MGALVDAFKGCLLLFAASTFTRFNLPASTSSYRFQATLLQGRLFFFQIAYLNVSFCRDITPRRFFGISSSDTVFGTARRTLSPDSAFLDLQTPSSDNSLRYTLQLASSSYPLQTLFPGRHPRPIQQSSSIHSNCCKHRHPRTSNFTTRRFSQPVQRINLLPRSSRADSRTILDKHQRDSNLLRLPILSHLKPSPSPSNIAERLFTSGTSQCRHISVPFLDQLLHVPLQRNTERFASAISIPFQTTKANSRQHFKFNRSPFKSRFIRSSCEPVKKLHPPLFLLLHPLANEHLAGTRSASTTSETFQVHLLSAQPVFIPS